jgi:hypothetical protein
MHKRYTERVLLVAIVVVALGFALMPWRRQIGSWLNPPRPSPLKTIETRLAAEDPSFLAWDLLRHTKGNDKTGPTFPEALAEQDGHEVTIACYMAPLDQYEKVDRFVLVPFTLECRVCQAPPSRDQVLLHMDRPTDLLTGLVVINGALSLHPTPQTPDPLFFYSVCEATVSPGFEDQDPAPLVVPKEHRHLPVPRALQDYISSAHYHGYRPAQGAVPYERSMLHSPYEKGLVVVHHGSTS